MINDNPNDYVYTNLVEQNLIKLPLEYQEGVLAIIHYHHILKLYNENSNIKKEEVILKLLNSSGKRSSIMNVSYGGKTTITGKGVTYNDASKLPLDLQKLIVAYFQMVTS